MTIPQSAVDAACDAYHRPGRMITNTAVGAHHDRMTAALEAAMPEIRKQIVADIETLGYNRAQTLELLRLGFSMDYINGYERAVTDAARVAGGNEK